MLLGCTRPIFHPAPLNHLAPAVMVATVAPPRGGLFSETALSCEAIVQAAWLTARSRCGPRRKPTARR